MGSDRYLPFLPLILNWIQQTLDAHAHERRAVSSFNFPRLPHYFSEGLLNTASVVRRIPDRRHIRLRPAGRCRRWGRRWWRSRGGARLPAVVHGSQSDLLSSCFLNSLAPVDGLSSPENQFSPSPWSALPCGGHLSCWHARMIA